ncbi:sensor histidine kinase [Cohnella sp. GCM10020058]|uniref:cache domain-containing sensor histidine kinase n=1 Tax=Cohnella sp. GCM10020058 TaxID=3317330 RepID=UPI003628E5E2
MNRWLLGFTHLRLRHKLMLSYLAVILIPILILGLYSYNQSRLFLQKQAEQGLRETVSAISDGFNAKLERYEGIINSIVLNGGLQRIFSNQYIDLSSLSYDVTNYLEPYFNMTLYLNDDIQQLRVYSQSDLPEIGEYMQAASKVKETDWYQDALREKATGWHYRQGAFIAARQFPDLYIHNNITVLYLKIDPQQVFGGFGNMSADGYGIAITDKRQHIVFSNRDGTGEKADTVERIVSSGQGIAEIDKVKYIVIQKAITRPDWTLTYYIPSDEIAVDSSSIVKATVVVIAICLLILLVLVWLFSHTLVNPILRLNKKMREVERGDLQVAVGSASRDEIGELTNRFGNMLGRINELIQEAYQNKIVQTEAELKALQSQINPHFLYNSLSIINWKSLQIDAQDISDMVTSLSRFYRTSLNKGSNVISVKDELDNIRSYIRIQLVMHDDSFDVEYDLDEEIYEYEMINLVLQPIVENAIEHGIDRIRAGRGRLRIAGKAEADKLIFTVEDNGPGMQAEVRDALLTTQTQGYGLKNVHDRLRLFFGEPYGVLIDSEPDRGTRMSVVIPKHRR